MAINKRSNAFSAVEMLIVMCVLTIMTAFLITVSAESDNGAKIARMEAEYAAMWLEEKMLAAQLNESRFTVYLHGIIGSRDLMMRVIWDTGPSKGQTEIYRMTSAHMRSVGTSHTFLYDGKWMTMTPSIAIGVKPPSLSDGTQLFLTVSGVGYTSVRDSLL